MKTSGGTKTISRVAVGTVVAALAATSLTGCAERSTEAFCNTVDEHKQVYLEQMEMAQSGDLAGLSSAITAMSGLGDMWEAMEKTAPSEIEPQVKEVGDAWSTIQDAAEDQDIITIGTTAMGAASAFTEVNDFVTQNCDV